MLELLVLAGEDLVLRERGPAAGAPLHGAVSFVQPAARVALLQEAPDVLDVRVGEGVVVVVPVHPHAEATRLPGDDLGVFGDPLLAALVELREPVLLDLALRVESQGALHADLDPEPLAVEAVLVALVEAAKRLVPLEHVLQRSPPAVMRPHRVVRGDRAVDEAEPRPSTVQLAQLLEDPFTLPEPQDLELERVVVGLVRER